MIINNEWTTVWRNWGKSRNHAVSIADPWPTIRTVILPIRTNARLLLIKREQEPRFKPRISRILSRNRCYFLRGFIVSKHCSRNEVRIQDPLSRLMLSEHGYFCIGVSGSQLMRYWNSSVCFIICCKLNAETGFILTYQLQNDDHLTFWNQTIPLP